MANGFTVDPADFHPGDDGDEHHHETDDVWIGPCSVRNGAQPKTAFLDQRQNCCFRSKPRSP
jgi:hypothetical protein